MCLKWRIYDQTFSAPACRTRMRKTNSTVSQTLPITVEWLCTLSSKRPSRSHSPISVASCPASSVRRRTRKQSIKIYRGQISAGILALFETSIHCYWWIKQNCNLVITDSFNTPWLELLKGHTEIIVGVKVRTGRLSHKARLYFF